MNAGVQEIERDAEDVEPLRLEPKRESVFGLVEDPERTDAFLAGERRILGMIAKDDSPVPVFDAMCRLVDVQRLASDHHAGNAVSVPCFLPTNPVAFP